ncbi:MAG: hypothetical protein ACLTIL_09010, partial [[Eubacterium] siraeum]
GRSPKRGEGGSPTLSPFPRGRGLGIGIENLLYFYKYRLFLQTEAGSKEPACKPHSTQKRKTASLQPLLRYAVSHDGKKSKNVR